MREESRPISGETGLFAIKQLAEDNKFDESADGQRGTLTTSSCLDDYVAHLLGYIDVQKLKPMKLVVNAGNGAAGHVVNAIEARFKELGVPIELIKVHNEPVVRLNIEFKGNKALMREKTK